MGNQEGYDEGLASGADGSVSAVVFVGLIMVGVLLISAVLEVYERSLLDSFYPSSPQFAFLRTIFPSPAYFDVVGWQNIIVLEVIPFLLFCYFAVRMSLNPLDRIASTVVALAIVGALLSIVESALSAYQTNISSLLVTGSLALPRNFGTESAAAFLSGFTSPLGVLALFGGALQFFVLGITGLAFGYFAGETPLWSLRRRLSTTTEE